MRNSSDSFVDNKTYKSYWKKILLLCITSIIFTALLIFYNNPISANSPSFYPIIRRRLMVIIVICIGSISHSLSTIAFQSLTNNRIITPSLLGFESLYSVIQTATIYFFGITTLINFNGNFAFITQLMLMMLFSLLIYSWLLFSKDYDLQFLLLIGIILGIGLRSISSFMSRLLSPNEYDILQARLFASVNNSKSESIPIAIILLIISASLLFFNSKKLNVFSLGKDIAINLGLNYKRTSLFILFLISMLISISTALIGPITFLGFLSALFTYHFANTYDHKYLFIMSIFISYSILAFSYFIMNHVFYAEGVVTIIIELIGGISFLFLVIRKGKL
ncbi:iron chelate uptake ABC transporter family permease subunit [Helcococcus kunzii]|uniref:Iron ABC transporter permease n=1 Tax=Helcococcus kunzii ATCC 51366 TaxID=883114 RepID=H3NMT3_9FIRM|nr:iron chelate uptake ABC transporter family permease subunit [Helcococcus kunzii]EHR34674.1 hypothetical protein HMPREF9709_00644 [Helcococcus kunzii ATCC 51366]QZO77000.1 iron chelate uptake ABC transporter family permease subunit [Helcococcus kunzii]